MQKREDNILRLEEQLKTKIQEVAWQLSLKEEEIVEMKQKCKEDHQSLEIERKRH